MGQRLLFGLLEPGKRLIQWRDVPGGFDSDGVMITEPEEANNARLILGLCDRFHCLPSQIYEEDAELFRMLTIEAMTKREEDEGDG